MGILGCPYCQFINTPGSGKPSTPTPEDAILDQSKTMLGPMEGEMADEITAVQRAVAGRKVSLPLKQKAVFEIVEGEEKGKRFILTKTEITLGRKQVDISLKDPEISRRHCAVILYGDLAVVKDMKSANGTMVNGHFVSQGLLRPGDTLQIGSIVLQFILSNP